LASGLFNTAQQVGGSLGLAILSTVAASRTTGLLHHVNSAASATAAQVSGYRVAFAVGTAMLIAAAAILALALRRRDLEAFEPELETSAPDSQLGPATGEAAALDGAEVVRA
jgi:hypothetical protein